MHKCKRCLKEFIKISHYKDHINRKFPCILVSNADIQKIDEHNKNNEHNENIEIEQNQNIETIKSDIISEFIDLIDNTETIDTIEINNNICPHCHKKFFQKSNVKNHLQKSCKVLKKNEIIRKNKENEMMKKIKEMFINQAPNNITNNNITNIDNSTTNNNTTNINNTQNIQVNIFSAGKEDLSRLSQEDILKICTAGTYYPIVAAEVIHCNKNYPEFQNFLISNLRSATGLVYSNDNWISKTYDELLTSLMRIDKKHVSTLIKDLKVDDKYKVKLESTKDEINTNESKEHQKPKIKAALYNASKMIIKNKKTKDKELIEE